MKELTPAAILPDLESLILTLRDQKVILDADLARIYGVPTRSLNQAVKRNLQRFPRDFVFRVTAEELEPIRSQIVSASDGSQTMTASRRNVRHLPFAFTEHGAIMAANVLNSPQATQMRDKTTISRETQARMSWFILNTSYLTDHGQKARHSQIR